MIEDSYKDISDNIKTVLESHVDINDDYHKVHKRRFARTLQVLMEQKPKGRLLELGCSTVIPLSLSDLAPDLEVYVTDFDLSKPIKHKLKISSNTKIKEIDAYSVDVEKTPLPAPDNYFDYVLCCEVLEHMEVDPMFMLSELNRVLKDDGFIILTTPNVVSSHGLTKMLLGIEPYFYMQYHIPGNYHRHNYEYSVHTLVALLKAAGFEGSVWTEDTFEEPITSTVEKLKNQGYKITHTGDNIFCVANKKSFVVDRYPRCIYV